MLSILSKLSPNGPSLLKAWDAFGSHALGRALVSRLLGQTIPYTGSINAVVAELERGRSKVEMPDRRAVRNHLGSVHAIALANLGEFSTGLAVISSLPESGRAILKSIHVEYHKKARGRLTAEAHCELPDFSGGVVKTDVLVVGRIYDHERNLVTSVQATWVVGPAKATEKK